MDPIKQFENEKTNNIKRLGNSNECWRVARDFMRETQQYQYTYHFSWMGRPIIQLPQDIMAIQEIVWQVRPELIIETGIAHGGSLIMSASLLTLLDYCDAVQTGNILDPRSSSRRRVLGIDIDIRAHNRAAIEAHPMAHKIDKFQGSSISPDIIAQVYEYAKGFERILVCLDSNHTHNHVLAELEAYAPLVSPDSYCVVFDTVIEDVNDETVLERSWCKGNNPKTAVWEYLSRLKEEGRAAFDGGPLHFEIDKTIDNKLLITVAPDGYLKRIKNG